MTDYSTKHLIIGAGFSGLGVAAAMVRAQLPFEVIEADDDLGGNWYHGVYNTVHIISSRKTTEYKDFPMPTGWSDFPSGAQMIEYLRSYADHWGLRSFITFGIKVERVAPAPNDRWSVTLSNGETRIYGGVVVSTGHHWDKRMPSYPGTFAGELIHSKDYKSNEQLAHKRVLVIGGGNSACDIAVEASRVGKASYISLRRGYWFLPKTFFGKPLPEIITPWMPVWFQRPFIKAMTRIIIGRYEDYGLPRPDHQLYEHHPTINSELLYALRHGKIFPKPDIKQYSGNTVEFVDGTRADFDLIVAATGYHMSVPILAEGVVQFKEGIPQVVGGCFPREYKNLYLFGYGQPRYGAGPLITLGAEALALIIKTQPQLKHPIGALLAAMGQKPLKSLLQDPFQLMRQIKTGSFIVSRLSMLEPYLMKNKTYAPQPQSPSGLSAPSTPTS
jgi:hypothetical protein